MPRAGSSAAPDDCRPAWAPAVKAWLCLLMLLHAAPAATAGRPLPVLRSARQVHLLSREKAERGYRVQVARAQITYLRPATGWAFLMDATGSVFASMRSPDWAGLRAGDMVCVRGVTNPGRVAPIIANARLHLLAHARLPGAPLVSFDRISSGAFDSRWISIGGIVKSASLSPPHNTGSDIAELRLVLTVGEDQAEVITVAHNRDRPQSLVDAKVRIRAAAGSEFNARGQFVGVRLYMPDLSYLTVLEPAPADPLALPFVAVRDITRVGPREPGHRVHVRGVITSAWGTRNFSLMDAEHGVYFASEDPAALSVGDLVEVAGFPSAGEFTAGLDNATVRRIGTTAIPPPVHVTVAEAFEGARDAEPIEVDSLLTGRSRNSAGIITLQLTGEGRSLVAVLPPGSPPEALGTLQPGSRLRIRGICIIHTDGYHHPQELNVLLRSPADVVVIASPSWWTLRHAVELAVLLFAMVLGVMAWNWVLRSRVQHQTRLIRAQLDESSKLRIQAEAAHLEKSNALSNLLALQRELLEARDKLQFQATHDSLTGLLNRAAVLEALHKEIERMLRTRSPIGVLLLDLDHFKTVNDTHGHLVGDAVLKEIGRRLTRTIRPYDVAGRYGGEEFLLVLPQCNLEETERSAQRIREAVSSLPFQAGKAEFYLTVSIGGTVVQSCPESDTALLSEADLALYEAKASGRNRTVMHCAPERAQAAPFLSGSPIV